jgi:single-stranded DNA-binding protein
METEHSGINKVILLGKITEAPRLLSFAYQKDLLCFPLVQQKRSRKKTGRAMS